MPSRQRLCASAGGPAKCTDSEYLRLAAILAISTFLIGACSSPPKQKIIYEKSGILIRNNTNRKIESVEWKECGQSEDDFRVVDSENLTSRKYLYIDIQSGCVDLIVKDSKQEIIGNQNNVNLPPRFYWNLH